MLFTHISCNMGLLFKILQIIIKEWKVIMNTLIFAYYVYMAVNLFTDLKFLKTKNFMHLLMLGAILIYSIFVSNNILVVVNTCLLSLVLGLLLTTVKGVSIGSGDLKMLVITSMFFQTYFVNGNPFLIAIVVYTFYFIISFLHLSVFRWFGRKKREFSLFTYTYKDGKLQVPDTLPIILTSLLIWTI